MKKPKKRFRQSIVIGAAAATLGLAGITGMGLASAATGTTDPQATLIEKLASKFNLNKDEVAAVFTADRQEHRAQMQADEAARLKQAVTDGKLTQAQADHIAAAQKEIEALHGTGGPGTETDATRTAIHAKMDALRTWAEGENIDLQYLGHGGHGPGGFGGPAPDSTSATQTN